MQKMVVPAVGAAGIRKFALAIRKFLNYGIFLVFGVIIIGVASVNPNFLTLNNFLNILRQACPFILIGIGMSIVMMTGGIDISAGQSGFMCAVFAVLAVNALVDSGFNTDGKMLLIIGCLIGIVGGGIVGAINGFFIAKVGMIPFVATLAMQNIVRAIGLGASNVTLISARNITRQLNTTVLGFGSWQGIPLIIFLTAVLVVVFDIAVRKYSFGRKIKAVGKDAVSAEKVGISTVRTKFFAYLICGSLAGLAGVLLGAQVGSVTITLGFENEFVAISGCVLGGVSMFGGKGSIIPGALVGIILTQMVFNGLAMINANAYLYIIVRGIIIFLVVMLDCIDYKGEIR